MEDRDMEPSMEDMENDYLEWLEQELHGDNEDYTVRQFLTRLEGFLEEELDETSRGNVFMAENGDGVSLNILIGTPFANSDEEINQVNVIIAPTDRHYLGSEGVSMDDTADVDEVVPHDEVGSGETETGHASFNRAMRILNG